MFGLPCFPVLFLSTKSKGSMSDHMVVLEFFAKEASFSWKTAKLDPFVLSEWEKLQIYRKYVTNPDSRQLGTLF